MSIRRTIEGLLQDPADQAAFREGPETFFAERGMTDLPSDLIGSSFGHFSDTAPIEQSDAVAGIATRFGPVPFEESDLPDFDPAADAVDPFATLDSLDSLDDVLEDRVDDLDDVTDDDTATEDTDDDTTGPDAATDEDTATDHTADDTAGPDDTADTTVETEPVTVATVETEPVTVAEERDAAPRGQADGDDGFGSGGFGTTSVLDDFDDDPFYDEVTSEDALTLDHFASADIVTTYAPDDDSTGFEPAVVEDSYETFPEEDTSAFDDIDPSDLELDDI